MHLPLLPAKEVEKVVLLLLDDLGTQNVELDKGLVLDPLKAVAHQRNEQVEQNDGHKDHRDDEEDDAQGRVARIHELIGFVAVVEDQDVEKVKDDPVQLLFLNMRWHECCKMGPIEEF